MAKITQWEDSLSYRTDEEVLEIEKALNVLSKWELFEKEYGGLAQLRTITGFEITSRAVRTTQKKTMKELFK